MSLTSRRIFKGTAKNKFTPDEDERLKKLVEAHGPKKWRELAEQMGNRTARQCRERWLNYLAPEIDTSPWSTEENQLLTQLIEEHGTRWALIATYFNARTIISLKNQWTHLKRMKNRIDQDNAILSTIQVVTGNCMTKQDTVAEQIKDDDACFAQFCFSEEAIVSDWQNECEYSLLAMEPQDWNESYW